MTRRVEGEGQRSREQLEAAGFSLRGNHFIGHGDRYLPLYEAKMMHQFNHRHSTYDGVPAEVRFRVKARTNHFGERELKDPHLLPLPRYWVHEQEVTSRLKHWNREWILGFRKTARSVDDRTAIAAILPITAIGDKVQLIISASDESFCLLANFCAYVFDYVVRQKVGGTDLSFFYVKQFPALPPHSYFDYNSSAQPSSAQPSPAQPSPAQEHPFLSNSSARVCWN